MRADIAPGGIFPDYELTDHTKTRRRLSELQGQDPLILVLSRGHFCPKDHQQHLEARRIKLEDRCRVHPDRHDLDRQHRREPRVPGLGRRPVDLPLRRRPQGPEGPRHPGYTDPHHDAMVPHTLVLKPGLVIHSIYNGYWFWGRPSIEDLRHDLRQATREIRSDWDINTPEQRAAWEAGDRSRFFHDVDLDPNLSRVV